MRVSLVRQQLVGEILSTRNNFNDDRLQATIRSMGPRYRAARADRR